MTLRLVTAGESHGPALVAILTGLPAGLVLDREAIDADLRRRQAGYGRSPRQQIETDGVEVLAGLRHGRTLGTPLALVVRNRDHKNWTWGMSPWPPEGEPEGKGTKPVTLPRPGHADLAGVLKYGHEDVRNALERASARHTAVHVAAGAVAKALLAELGVVVAGRAIEIGGATGDEGMREATDAARADRDTLGGIGGGVATGVPPGAGSYAGEGGWRGRRGRSPEATRSGTCSPRTGRTSRGSATRGAAERPRPPPGARRVHGCRQVDARPGRRGKTRPGVRQPRRGRRGAGGHGDRRDLRRERRGGISGAGRGGRRRRPRA